MNDRLTEVDREIALAADVAQRALSPKNKEYEDLVVANLRLVWEIEQMRFFCQCIAEALR